MLSSTRFLAVLSGLFVVAFPSALSFDATATSRRDFFVNAGIHPSACGAMYLAYSAPVSAAGAGDSTVDGDVNAGSVTASARANARQESNTADECDEECKEIRRKRIEDRRAMMKQSRSSTSRQEVFELSKQRAKLYGSEYKGANCVEGIPCL
mmetsp:Transcript_37962/g.83242  ORF Transcript_37962/g.83242 Transcript_37962/m.83242 type:complete len:153 (+) Transcript_37962:61-519(+)